MAEVIGFYQSRADADRVRQELIVAGFDDDDVRVFSRSSGSTSATTADDEPGFWESIKNFFRDGDESDHHLYAEASRRGSVGVCVDADDDAEVRQATEIMQRGGPINLDSQAETWRKSGWTGGHATATAAAATGAAATNTAPAANRATATTGSATQANKEVVPVVEEQLQVGKRQVQGGAVRVHTRITERPVQEQVNLREEHVHVERRPVDRPVTAADQNAFRERTIEATETAERAVVSKEARVVEEVVVSKDVNQRTETVSDTVRRTDVEVNRTPAGASATGASFTDPDTFASELAADARYRNRDWTALEPDARRSFEQRYPGSKWEQFKDSIHRGYEKVRQKV